MEKQFDPQKPDEAMKLAFRAHQLALTDVLATAGEALAKLSERNRLERGNKA